MSGHVGDRLSALVDGELNHEDRDQVLAHVACCQQCRQALEAERQVCGLVGSLRSEERMPSPSPDMMSSLLQLGAGAERPEQVDQFGIGVMPAAGRRPDRSGPLGTGGPGGSTRPSRRSTQRFGAPRFGMMSAGSFAYAVAHPGPGTRLALGVAGAASLFGMTAALAFALNGAPAAAPRLEVTPPTQQMGVEDAKIIPDYPSPGTGVDSDSGSEVLGDLVDPSRAPGETLPPGAPAGIQPYGR